MTSRSWEGGGDGSHCWKLTIDSSYVSEAFHVHQLRIVPEFDVSDGRTVAVGEVRSQVP